MLSHKAHTAKMFETILGFKPLNDDLQRINCPDAGKPGHMSCGWNYVLDQPVFQSCASDVDTSGFIAKLATFESNHYNRLNKKVRHGAHWLLAETVQLFYVELNDLEERQPETVLAVYNKLETAAFDLTLPVGSRSTLVTDAMLEIIRILFEETDMDNANDISNRLNNKYAELVA